jgi:hypothetical protein
MELAWIHLFRNDDNCCSDCSYVRNLHDGDYSVHYQEPKRAKRFIRFGFDRIRFYFLSPARVILGNPSVSDRVESIQYGL